MLNQELLGILRKIKAENAHMFSNPKQLVSMLKDLTENNHEYNAIIRWIKISLSDFDAFNKIESDFNNKLDFARHTLLNRLIDEGASIKIAEEVIGYLAVLAGFSEELICTETNELIKKAEQGDAASQCELGWYYIFGEDGYEINFDSAVEWLKTALSNPASSEECRAKAAFYMSMLYYDPSDRPIMVHDVNKTIYWLVKAVDGGNDNAMQNLLNILYSEDNDCTRGGIFIAALQKFANTYKSPKYMVALADIYRNMQGNPFIEKWTEFVALIDNEKAFSLCKEAGEIADEIIQSGNADPLGFNTYNSIIQTLSVEKERVRELINPDGSSSINIYNDYIELAEAQLRYMDRALAIAKNEESMPREYFDIQGRIREMIVGGLNSVKEAAKIKGGD